MQTQRDEQRQERRGEPLTNADLAQAIARREVPAIRQGDDYIVRAADFHRLQRRPRRHVKVALRPDAFEVRFH